MKRLLVFAVAVSMVLVAASASYAVIANSKHDLSNASTATIKETAANLSSCQFCHTPHHSNNSVTGAPLWNRTISAGYSTAGGASSYTVYGNTTGAGNPGATLSGTAVGAPGTNSKTCLSCHDGTLSLGNVIVGTDSAGFNDYGTARLTGGLQLTGGPAALGGANLTAEHPIGVVYNTAVTAAGLNAVGGTGSGAVLVITGQATKRWVIYGGGNGVGTVQCGSCHDPHNTVATETPFLKGAKATICTDCHSAK